MYSVSSGIGALRFSSLPLLEPVEKAAQELSQKLTLIGVHPIVRGRSTPNKAPSIKVYATTQQDVDKARQEIQKAMGQPGSLTYLYQGIHYPVEVVLDPNCKGTVPHPTQPLPTCFS